MRERPILFNGAVVRAIPASQKTQTLRAVKPDGAVNVVRFIGADNQPTGECGWRPHSSLIPRHVHCPFGQPGDRLWVRETWTNAWDEGKNQWSGPERYHYRADGIEVARVDGMERLPWIPCIHMPRRASRLVLEITAVRVERLQAISEAEVLAEGMSESLLPDIRLPRHHPRAGRPMVYADSRELFADLWDSAGGDWDSNPVGCG